MNELEQRSRDLEAFANAGGQPIQPSLPPHGQALVRPTTGLADRVIGAQHVDVYRDEARVLQKLTALGAAAGPDWFYRFPVKKKDGGVDWIEGPSIKLANDVARIYGNNVVEVREHDVGDAWVFHARLTDIETGYSSERLYRQRKSQGSMKTKDADRQLDIAYQIGQSKAIRNVIVNGLQTFADYAFDAARNSLVEKIGKDLAGWRERTLVGLAKMPVDAVRVERAIGRGNRDWLAPHIAQVISMMKSVADGMATVDEVFPPIEAPAPAAAHADTAVADQGGGGAQSHGSDGTPAADAGLSGHASSGVGDSAAAATTDADTDDDELVEAHQRGRDAKHAGHKRQAPSRTSARIQAAWLAGFDGKSL